MRLPHVTIEYREDDGFVSSIGKMSYELILGFGVHWAWIYLVVFNGAMLFHPASQGMHSLMAGLTIGVMGVVLLTYAFKLKQLRQLFDTPRHRRRNRRIAACMSCVGAALLFLGGGAGATGIAVNIAAGILAGIGSAVLLMSYGVSFSVCDIATVVTSFALSLIPATVIFALFMMLNTMIFPVGALFCLIFPFIELICLARASSQLVDNLEFTSITIPVKMSSFVPRLCIPSLLFGFAVGIIRNHALIITPTLWDAFADCTSVIIASILACGLLIFAMLIQRQTINFIFRTTMPIVALFLVLAYVVEAQSSWWFDLLLFCSYLLLEGCLWIAFADMSQRYRISAFTVYGLGRGSMAIGTLISFILTSPSFAVSHILTNMIGIVMVSYVILTLAYCLMPKVSEIRRSLLVGEHCPVFLVDDDFAVEGLSKKANATSTNSNSIDNDIQDEKAKDAISSTDNATIHTNTGKTTQHKAQPSATTPKETPVTQVAAHQHQQTNTATPADTRAHSAAASPHQPASPNDSSDNPAKQGRFKRKVAAVADLYMLSARETEVLFMLAKGNNATAIQESLFISAGTVNTHMRHIYRKLDIHSQQELIDLVDSMDVPDEKF